MKNPLLFTFALLLATSALAHPVPTELVATWEQVLNDKKGTMKISQKQVGKHTIEGKLEIVNSGYCPDPIPFRGTIVEKKVLITSIEEVVCGFGGVLTGEVLMEAPDIYVGSFSYRFIGIVWARGTFRLSEKVKE